MSAVFILNLNVIAGIKDHRCLKRKNGDKHLSCFSRAIANVMLVMRWSEVVDGSRELRRTCPMPRNPMSLRNITSVCTAGYLWNVPS